MEERNGLKVYVSADANAGPVSRQVRTQLFDAVRELLFNVVKHANVKEAWLTMDRLQDNVRIVVADSGCGFDPSARGGESESTGYGLFNVRRRLEFLGGRTEIVSTAAVGTRVTLLASIGDKGQVA